MIDTIRYGDLLDPLVAVPNGSHETALARARTSTSISRVLVKRIPLHELVREVLCNLLAQAVGLPVPAPYVLDVRRSSWFTPNARHVFGTDYSPRLSLVRAARQAPATLDYLLQWPSLLATIAFDEWIANSDRTAGNLLYIGPKDFQLIDHGDALPNRIDPTTKLANRLARHLVASSTSVRQQDFARRVLDSCANFGKVDFEQIEEAAMSSSWGEHMVSECIRLLIDRRTQLPTLIEEEFRVIQGQLLA